MTEPTSLPDDVQALLGAYLGRQRWYAGSTDPPADAVHTVNTRVLWSSEDHGHTLWSAIVEAEGARYQVLIGERPGGESADFLSGREEALLGAVGSCYFYDATVDPEMSLHLLEVVTDGAESAERVRPVSVEQSNTSLVYDDRVIVKIFRRLAEGPNPDVVVTTALAGAGFGHVAAPVASWRVDNVDLAFAQQFLVGGSEGWALALTSLRDFYNGDTDVPGDAGGDFAGEASRLGAMTARMHLAMAGAFGVEPDLLIDGGYAALIDDVSRRLDAVVPALGNDLAGPARSLIARLRAVAAPGPALRVHGDYHLGQVMRTDTGWYVLDFEGEPARPVTERITPASPAKDVAGMLRSFHYASRFATRERSGFEQQALGVRARAWEDHNREAFVGGYRSIEGIDALLPGNGVDLLAAYELDKALYELDYERAYRPDWVDIPNDAVVRILGEGDRPPRPSGPEGAPG
ncbi:MAG: phosphotransferase [Actinomycetota bacterium]|nr:phosphotransferase [Actinomycetota bacterium]